MGTTTYAAPYSGWVGFTWYEKKTDQCLSKNASSDTLVEYYCKEGKIESDEKPCEAGKKCISVTTEEGEKLFCKGTCDETDEDNSPYAFGTVYTETNVPYPDYCSGNTVYQFRCNGLDELDEAPFYDCAQDGAICLDGACIQK